MPTPPAVHPEEALLPMLQKHGREPGSLLQILIEVQHAFHCVPAEAVDFLSEKLGVSRVRVRGLISFYSFLSEAYEGEYVIHFSDNITDQMLANRALATRLCEKLRVKIGETRADGRVSVHFTSCTGMCDQGPAALINYLPVTRLTPDRIDQIASLVETKVPFADWPRELFKVETQIRRSDVVFRRPIEPGDGIRASLERGGEILEEWAEDLAPSDAIRHHLERGGAEGFKTSIKWESVRNAKSGGRYVLCNADEGEPGTFKDRVLLTGYADTVFEGMTVCGHVVGSKKGILYLRQEYWYMKDHLEGVLKRRREAGLLGKRILGTGLEFDIEIHWGAGAYICGMESAMIKSIEGRRGIPRRRWPLPVHQGYMKKPTVVNNVETFAAAALISAKGGAWFAYNGTPQSSGTKLFCVSGDCERPGIYEYPWGITVREVLRDCGALDAQGVQMGGASGTMIHPSEFDRNICFEDLTGTGTVMVFGPKRDLFDAVKNFSAFFQHESCGLCTPCRVGTTLLANYVKKFDRGWGSPVDVAEIKHIADVMKTMAHCGLGQTASNHIIDSIQKFEHLWTNRMKTTEFIPAFDLDGALEEARMLTDRTDPDAHLVHEEA
jgi:[NiFe] hydrogenase diaphorase moiety large subunit